MVETEFVCFLDDDHEVTPGWLDAQVGCIRRSSAAAVGCRFLESNGSLQKGLPVMGPSCHPVYFGQDTREPANCQFVPLGGGIYSVDALRSLNGMDEEFFLAHADIDLCYRLRYFAGASVVYNPHAEVFHHKQRITGETNPLRRESAWRDLELFRKRWAALIAAEPDLGMLRAAWAGGSRNVYFRDDFSYKGESADVSL